MEKIDGLLQVEGSSKFFQWLLTGFCLLVNIQTLIKSNELVAVATV